jgi:threonine dehydrogenase-like Zn-dependent dehydrogenase
MKRMSMKALQVVKPRTFQQVEIPVPSLAADGGERILVQPNWVSMCGSDIPFFTGNKRHKSYPLPVGAPIHECAGQVVESTSTRFKPFDRVVAIPEGDQGLAEFFVAKAEKAVKLPAELDNNGMTCLIQPLSTVVNAVDRLENVAGKSVAVVGLGSIGLFFVWLLKKRGAARVVGIDPIAERCQIAQKLGVDEVYPMRSIEILHRSRQDPEAWNPPEICIEAVGHQMETLNDCLALAKQRGTVLAFGVPDQNVYAIEYESFFRKNIHLVACVTPDWSEYLSKARDLYLAHHAELAPLVTHRLPIRDANDAFTLYENHEGGVVKALIDMSYW